MSNEKTLSWWLKVIIAVLSAIAGAIGGGVAVACDAVVV